MCCNTIVKGYMRVEGAGLTQLTSSVDDQIDQLTQNMGESYNDFLERMVKLSPDIRSYLKGENKRSRTLTKRFRVQVFMITLVFVVCMGALTFSSMAYSLKSFDKVMEEKCPQVEIGWPSVDALSLASLVALAFFSKVFFDEEDSLYITRGFLQRHTLSVLTGIGLVVSQNKVKTDFSRLPYKSSIPEAVEVCRRIILQPNEANTLGAYRFKDMAKQVKKSSKENPLYLDVGYKDCRFKLTIFGYLIILVQKSACFSMQVYQYSSDLTYYICSNMFTVDQLICLVNLIISILIIYNFCRLFFRGPFPHRVANKKELDQLKVVYAAFEAVCRTKPIDKVL